MIRFKGADRVLSGNFHQIVELAVSDEAESRANRLLELRGRIGRFHEGRRKIHLDPLPDTRAGEYTALCVEARGGMRGQAAFFPENVRAGKSGVTAKSDFDCGREPTEVKRAMIFGVWDEKRRFREIHFHCDAAPSIVRREER